MVARNSARYLAPVALVATIAGGYLIVHHNMATKPPPAAHGTTTRSGHRSGGKFAKARFYIVRPNETLTSISDLTGVSLGTLEALNPSSNPNALQTGQRIRLRQ